MKLLNTPEILKAAFQGDVALVKQLLDDDATVVDAVDELGRTPLIIAAHTNNLELVELLLQHNADINKRSYCG